MKYLSIEEAYFLHELALKESGGRSGIRDFSLLHSAISRPLASFGEEELYPDIFSKAVALIHSFILNCPFEDGNKRTGFFAVNAFLIKNNYVLRFSTKEAISFCLQIENKKLNIGKIVSWLKRHAKKK